MEIHGVISILEEVADALGLVTNPSPCRHCGARVAVRMPSSRIVDAETQRMAEALAEHEADCLCGGTVCSEKST